MAHKVSIYSVFTLLSVWSKCKTIIWPMLSRSRTSSLENQLTLNVISEELFGSERLDDIRNEGDEGPILEMSRKPL